MEGRSFLGVCLAVAGCLPADELENYSDGSGARPPAPVSSAMTPSAPSPATSTSSPDAPSDAEATVASPAVEAPSPTAASEAEASESEASEADSSEADPSEAAPSEAETSPQPLRDPDPVPASPAPGTSSSSAGESDAMPPAVSEETPAETEPEPPPAAPSRFRFVRLVADTSVQGPYTSIAEFNLIDGAGVALDRSAWVASADSEETVYVGGAGARFAIDGDPSTMWHTAWFSVSPAPAHPHTLDVDLGSLQEVGGFRYLARQDGSLDGRIAAFRFYLSVDGQDWGEPVVRGTLANSDQEQEITLP